MEDYDFTVYPEEYDLDDPFLDEFFEFRLFSVRIYPCNADRLPDHITLRCSIAEPYEFLEINGIPISRTEEFPVTLHRERLNRDWSQVTYTTTDRITTNAHGMFFDVVENGTLIAHGDFGKWKCDWKQMDNIGLNTDMRTGFVVKFQPYKTLVEFLGGRGMSVASGPSVEVFVAGCCSGVPVAVTSTEPVVSN